MDPGGAVVTWAATFADATSGVATKACTPASGSTFPVGPTTVTCSATDKAGNSGSGSFTVTVGVQTAMQAKQAVLAILKEELACTTNRDLKARLADAIGHLKDSLVPGLWVSDGPLADGNHLVPATGGQVFDAEKAAVASLMGIRKPSSAVSAAITTLDAADRLLAQAAIDDAVAAHADPGLIATAQQEMASAQADVAKRRYNLAIDHWKAAWSAVTQQP